MSTAKALEQFEFHQTLESSRGTGIVFFSSEECQSCRYWEEILNRLTDKHPDITVFKIDAGLDQALTEEFDVFHLPSLFLYRDGQYHSPLQAEARIDAIEKAIAQALAKPAQEMP